MAYDALAIANELLFIAKKEKAPVTPMKLQKLLYYAYGHYLAANEERLFNEEIQAWRHGPVVASVYSDFREYGNAPITDQATRTVRENGKPVKRVATLGDDPRSETIREYLRDVWEAYGEYSAARLSNATHQPGTPWAETVKACGGKIYQFQDIDDDLIARYFKEIDQQDD